MFTVAMGGMRCFFHLMGGTSGIRDKRRASHDGRASLSPSARRCLMCEHFGCSVSPPQAKGARKQMQRPRPRTQETRRLGNQGVIQSKRQICHRQEGQEGQKSKPPSSSQESPFL